MLAATAGASEWLLRRYRPRFRWSLRTMLAVMGLLAASFAWFGAARERAGLEDSIIDALDDSEIALPFGESKVSVERSGPQWLDLFGVDRYRRHIVFAKLRVNEDREWVQWRLNSNAVGSERLLKRVQRLDKLQHLALIVDRITPSICDTLGKLPHLRKLRIEVWNSNPDATDALVRSGEILRVFENHWMH